MTGSGHDKLSRPRILMAALGSEPAKYSACRRTTGIGADLPVLERQRMRRIAPQADLRSAAQLVQRGSEPRLPIGELENLAPGATGDVRLPKTAEGAIRAPSHREYEEYRVIGSRAQHGRPTGLPIALR